jgi:hypothetical protein
VTDECEPDHQCHLLLDPYSFSGEDPDLITA